MFQDDDRNLDLDIEVDEELTDLFGEDPEEDASGSQSSLDAMADLEDDLGIGRD